MTETEVARLETICDDLEAGYALDPELHWPLGEWRYLQDLLGALRETPKHLLSVSASTDALRRVGHVRIAAARPAHLTLPATMIGGYRDDGSYWAADETRELWMQVGHVELEPGSPTPPADVLLDSTGEWSPAAVRSTDRRYEFETRDGVRVLHGAVVLEDDDGELHVVLLTMRCDDDHDAVAALESVSIVA